MKLFIVSIYLLSQPFAACTKSDENSQFSYILVLGIAQDAGYPQAGCYKPHCMDGWKGRRKQLGAVSLGLVDNINHKKYMFEATPDFANQHYRLQEHAPDADYDFSGIFLTHAHIGHYTGLMFLGHEAMGASSIPVFAMPKMAQFIKNNGPWSQLVNYKNVDIIPLADAKTVNLGEIKVTPMIVPHRDEYSETVGFKIQGAKKSAIFIPDINKWNLWDTDIAELIKSVDYALLDASFYAEGEIPGRDMSQIPHPFVTETINTLKELNSKQRNKVWFIHMNHTNPMLNPKSKESKYVEEQGFNIAREGIKFAL